MAITFSLKGLGGTKAGAFHVDEIIHWDDKLIMGLVEADVVRGIRKATLEVERDAKALIRERGAEVHTVSAGEGVREPSLPGHPPHQVTGSLFRDVSHEFRNDGLTGVVGTDLPHGRWLEFGTSKMMARPWLRPALSGVMSRAETFFGNSKF
ncbi:hypothetical protein LCGC14_0323430 [marine sediment metagenome]|uniref:HK97 gp10 family phage protein n=1 Tax=marine sediment metagenome TaxID=412755 RepID=A0A0F9TP68_9ZZZZ